jgi:hypothetical protein
VYNGVPTCVSILVPGVRILDTPKSATFIRVSFPLDASRMFSGCNRIDVHTTHRLVVCMYCSVHFEKMINEYIFHLIYLMMRGLANALDI